MKIESHFRCDLCNKKFDIASEVRNDVSILNGTHGKVFGHVCDPCIVKLSKVVDREFPKNSRLMKLEQAAVKNAVAVG